MVPILTNQRWKPQHGKMSVARPMGWFLVSISDPRAKESEVHGWRQCESLLFSLSSIAAWHQLCWCILFVQHMSPSENCHIQAHVAFTARAQLAVPKAQESSTRSQSFAAGYCCPYSGSWPPSDLVPFFFVPMPCALEALTVINPLFRLSLSKGETITKVSQSPNKNQTKHHKANKTQKQTGHPKGVKHYAFRNFPMPLSTAPQRNSKYLS